MALYVYRFMYRNTVLLYTTYTDVLYFCEHNTHINWTHMHTDIAFYAYRFMYRFTDLHYLLTDSHSIHTDRYTLHLFFRKTSCYLGVHYHCLTHTKQIVEPILKKDMFIRPPNTHKQTCLLPHTTCLLPLASWVYVEPDQGKTEMIFQSSLIFQEPSAPLL